MLKDAERELSLEECVTTEKPQGRLFKAREIAFSKGPEGNHKSSLNDALTDDLQEDNLGLKLQMDYMSSCLEQWNKQKTSCKKLSRFL